MKHLITTLGFCLLISALHAQKYMDELTDKTCDCFSNLPAETPESEYQLKFGLCLFENAANYKKELKKDFQIDLDNLNNELGEKLGQLVGVRIAFRCPKVLEKLASLQRKETDETSLPDAPESVPIFGLTGFVSRIEQDFFVIFSIKNENNVTTKFYWLTPVSSNVDLPGEYNKLLDKKVILEYKEELIVDPKIGDYRKINVITSLNQQ